MTCSMGCKARPEIIEAAKIMPPDMSPESTSHAPQAMIDIWRIWRADLEAPKKNAVLAVDESCALSASPVIAPQR